MKSIHNRLILNLFDKSKLDNEIKITSIIIQCIKVFKLYFFNFRYSMFDPLELEYALIRAAARGSVGPYSLSESLHKLTFTQSLAFPALARSLAAKQNASANDKKSNNNENYPESGINCIAKVVTAFILIIVSILIFGVIYKFIRT